MDNIDSAVYFIHEASNGNQRENKKSLQHSQLHDQGEFSAHKCHCMMTMTTVWSESLWGFYVLPITVKASAQAMAANWKTKQS